MSTSVRAYGLSYDNLPELIAGNVSTLPCACGSTISCTTDAEGIRVGVASHQRTSPHREWREREYPSEKGERRRWTLESQTSSTRQQRSRW